MNYRDKIIGENELKGEQIRDGKFIACRLAGANLKFSSFTKCVFEDCDFSGVVFEGTSFEECSFPGSKLSNLDFAPTTLIKCDFRGAVVENSVFQHYKTGTKDELVRYDLRECRFDQATLLNTVWIKCDLAGVDFDGSKLAGVIFDRCKLTKAKLVGADITGVNFEGSIIDHTELDIQGFVQYGNSRGFVMGTV